MVPGYYGTYWVKHLSEIQVIDQVFDGFWMKPAYRIPDNDCACVEPGTAPAATSGSTRSADAFDAAPPSMYMRSPIGTGEYQAGIAHDAATAAPRSTGPVTA